jgi:hypothetical protein
MSPFAPKGDRAQKVIVVELAAKAQPGDLITFDAMAEALDLDPAQHRERIRQAVTAARPILLADHKRCLVADPGHGYRVAFAREFAGIAQTHRRKADRQIGKAMAVIDNVDVADMTPAELQRHQAVGVVMRNLVGRMTSAEERLGQLEAMVFGAGPKVIKGQVEQEDEST